MAKKNLKYNFFKDYDYKKFKRLTLRNSGNDTYLTMYKDAFIHNLTKHLNFETQEYSPSIVFINSEFYGIFNLREKYDEKYFNRIYNIEEDQIYILENEGIEKNGDPKEYNDLMYFIENNDLKDDYNYNYVSTKIDYNSLIDYFLTEIFIDNVDWPANNNQYWRKKIDFNDNTSYGHDGKWRWMLNDTDLAMLPDNYKNNSLYRATDTTLLKSNYYNLHFVKLLENDSFRIKFINRFSDLLNTTFQYNRLINLINLMQDNLRQEMPKNISRWNLITSMDQWERNVEVMREFARLRPDIQKSQLNDFFNLGGKYQLNVQTNNKSLGFVKVNSIEINNTTIGIDDDYQNWKGDYFINNPVTLEAIALPGYVFSHWEGDVESKEQKIVIDPEKDFKAKAIFEWSLLATNDLDKVDFLVYPNPVSDILNVSSASKTKIEYKISTILGQIVEENKTNDQKIDVSHLSKGTYIIQLTQDNKRVTKKFIKY